MYERMTSKMRNVFIIFATMIILSMQVSCTTAPRKGDDATVEHEKMGQEAEQAQKAKLNDLRGLLLPY